MTERAVFQRSADHDVIELIEIAPGIDLQKDVLDQLEFTPAISPDLNTMDPRIFKDEKMEVTAEMFGSFEDRCVYHEDDHQMFIDLFGITLNNESDVQWFSDSLQAILDPPFKAKGPINIVVQYDGFDLRKGLEDVYAKQVALNQAKYYKTVQRYAGAAFHRAKLGSTLGLENWDMDELYDEFDANGDGDISIQELRDGMAKKFQIHLTPAQIEKFQNDPGDSLFNKEQFSRGIEEVLKSS